MTDYLDGLIIDGGNIMAGRMSKQKGARYERKVAKILGDAFGSSIRRTPASGALGIKGDLCQLEGNFDLPSGLSDWCIECKCQERMNIWQCLNQAFTQAGHKKAALIFSRNREDDYVCIGINDFIELIQRSK